jgi:hypothetical protein
MFGALALERWDVQEMTSFEPDPENAGVLRATIHDNARDRWSMHGAAVSNAAGTMSFLPGQLAESRRAGPDESGIEVPTRPVPNAHVVALTFLTDAGYEIHRDRVDLPRGHTGLIWATPRLDLNPIADAARWDCPKRFPPALVVGWFTAAPAARRRSAGNPGRRSRHLPVSA